VTPCNVVEGYQRFRRPYCLPQHYTASQRQDLDWKSDRRESLTLHIDLF